jgi:YD repeat-containing protein
LLCGGLTYTQNFDAENRLTSVLPSPGGIATSFKYNGDGNLVAKLVGNVTASRTTSAACTKLR